jgi:transposase-like protein
VKGTALSKQRRVYTAAFKLDTVLEGLCGEKPVAQICRERSSKDPLSDKWCEQFQRRAGERFVEGGRPQVDEAKEAHIAELERWAV